MLGGFFWGTFLCRFGMLHERKGLRSRWQNLLLTTVAMAGYGYTTVAEHLGTIFCDLLNPEAAPTNPENYPYLTALETG